MKSTGIIIGASVLLLLAGNGSLDAQKNQTDTTRINRQWRGHMEMSSMRHMRGMGQGTDSLKMNEIRDHRGYMHMRDRRPYMYGWRMEPGMQFGYPPPMYGMRGRGPEGWDRFGWRQHFADKPGIADIPNLTDKQKKEIADLRQQYRDEMVKFRDEIKSKFQGMRESHRKEIMNLLTDEQKRFLESGSDKTNMGSSKEK